MRSSPSISIRLKTTHFKCGQQLLSFDERLRRLCRALTQSDQLISSTFDSDATTLAGSDPFLNDKALLDDILVSVKISTAI